MSPGSPKKGQPAKPKRERFWQRFHQVPKKVHPETKKISASWCKQNLARANNETRQKIIDVIMKWKFLTPKQFRKQVISRLEKMLKEKGY